MGQHTSDVCIFIHKTSRDLGRVWRLFLWQLMVPLLRHGRPRQTNERKAEDKQKATNGREAKDERQVGHRGSEKEHKSS